MNKDKSSRTNYSFKLFLFTFISFMFIELSFKLITFKSLFGLELIRIMLFSMGASLIISFICSLFKVRTSKIIVSICVFLVGFYALLQLTFYNLLGNYMSLNASSGGGLSRVLSQVPEFISAIKIQYLQI